MATRKKKVTEEVVEEVKAPVEAPSEEPAGKRIEIKLEKKPVKQEIAIGVVYNCVKLFVRSYPDKTKSTIVTIISAGTEVTIDKAASTKDFYKVSFPGFSGYCDKSYIEMK